MADGAVVVLTNGKAGDVELYKAEGPTEDVMHGTQHIITKHTVYVYTFGIEVQKSFTDNKNLFDQVEFGITGTTGKIWVTGDAGLSYRSIRRGLIGGSHPGTLFWSFEHRRQRAYGLYRHSKDRGKPPHISRNCTPYGVNDHRLLVTGVRTEYDPDEASSDGGVPFTSTSWFADYARAVLIWIAVITAILLIRRFLQKRRQA